MKNNIEKYNFSSSDKLFFDTNILIYLDGPIANVNRHHQAIYASAFAKMIQSNANLFIDATVISEFANRYLRLAYDPFKNTISFKKYRDSKDGKKSISNVCSILKKRLQYFSVSSSDTNKNWLLGIIEELHQKNGDFNDYIIAEICRKNSLSLVTHDGDMGKMGIPIISANKNLYS